MKPTFVETVKRQQQPVRTVSPRSTATITTTTTTPTTTTTTPKKEHEGEVEEPPGSGASCERQEPLMTSTKITFPFMQVS